MVVGLESAPLPSWLTTLTRSHGFEIRRRRIGTGFAGNTAAVARFPGRSGEMFAEGLAILVEKLCIGSLQCPSELPGVTFAGVHLVALRMNLEKKFFICRWLELLRDLLRGSREQKNRASGGEQRGGCESEYAIAHATLSPVRACVVAQRLKEVDLKWDGA
jgi:hypothetical protein